MTFQKNTKSPNTGNKKSFKDFTKYYYRKLIYEKALEAWGAESQCNMLIEEASEVGIEAAGLLELILGTFKVIRSLRKLDRASKASYPMKRMLLQEELADLIIMTEQLRLIFGEDDINEMIVRKMKRLEEEKLNAYYTYRKNKK